MNALCSSRQMENKIKREKITTTPTTATEKCCVCFSLFFFYTYISYALSPAITKAVGMEEETL